MLFNSSGVLGEEECELGDDDECDGGETCIPIPGDDDDDGICCANSALVDSDIAPDGIADTCCANPTPFKDTELIDFNTNTPGTKCVNFEPIPEFSIFGIIAAIVVIGLGTAVIIRRRKQ